MSRDRDEKSAADRRDFLKLATVGTVLGGAAVAAGGSVQAAVRADAEGAGYRETDHVKRYYDLSRF